MGNACAIQVAAATIEHYVVIRTVDLLPSDALNVDDPLFPVYLHNFSFSSLQLPLSVSCCCVAGTSTLQCLCKVVRHGEVTLYVPLTTVTSSSFRTGTAPTCITHERAWECAASCLLYSLVRSDHRVSSAWAKAQAGAVRGCSPCTLCVAPSKEVHS